MLSRVGGRCQGIGAAVLAAALLLSGCSDAGEPGADPTTSGADSATSADSAGADAAGGETSGADPAETDEPTEPVATASPQPKPDRPAAMDDTGEKGAVAAAEYFFELYNYAASTGEVDEFQEIADSDCDFCAGMAGHFRDAYGRGEWIRGYQAEISNLSVKPTVDGLAYEVTFDLEVGAGQVVSKDGVVDEMPSVAERGARVGVQRFEDWRVLAVYSGVEAE